MSNALEPLGTNAISVVSPTVTIATLRPLNVTSAESFWYVIQCVAFGAGYFAKVPMKKALSDAGVVSLTSAENFWYVLQCVAFGAGYFAKVPHKRALADANVTTITNAENFWYVLQCVAFGAGYFAKVPVKRALADANVTTTTDAENFWYVLMCIPFGAGYFAKVPYKKALSEVGRETYAPIRETIGVVEKSVCPNGHPVVDESKEFCGECGARVLRTCSKGHALLPGARFCPVCGETITVGTFQSPSAVPVPAPASGSRSAVPWILGAVALVVIIIVIAVVLLSRHSVTNTTSTTTLPLVSTPSTTSVLPPATAFSQASAINHLLRSAPQDRAQLQNAVDVIQSSIDERNGTCSPAAVNAVSEIQTVANGREDLLIQLSVTSMSDVPGGGQVHALLRSAWTISLQIDRAFGQWATVELDNGCAVSDSAIPSYHTTAILDPQSTAIKTRFVEDWNPIASQYGLPANWSADQI